METYTKKEFPGWGRWVLGVTATFVALLLGMGLGYLVADGEPDVRTETKTVKVPTEAKTVEVPAKPETVEVEVETPVTPESCLEAIDASEKAAGVSAEFANTTSKFPPLVAEAFQAGLLQNEALAEDIAARMDGFTAEMQDQRKRLEVQVERFNSAKADCRAH